MLSIRRIVCVCFTVWQLSFRTDAIKTPQKDLKMLLISSFNIVHAHFLTTFISLIQRMPDKTLRPVSHSVLLWQYVGSMEQPRISSLSSQLLTYEIRKSDLPCGLVVRVLGYRSGGLGSIPGTTRKKSSGSGTGSTQLRSYLIEK
jgi:hypothetical protein